eukprot:3792494-Pyramimonas_sp.AAC.2
MHRRAWLPMLLLLVLLQHLCPARAAQPENALAPLLDPSDEATAVREGTFHCEVMCCGFGHRMAVVLEAYVSACDLRVVHMHDPCFCAMHLISATCLYHAARALNKTLAVSWGPCKEHTKNVFAALFARTNSGGKSTVEASDQAISWNPRSEAHNDCRSITGKDQR